VLATLVVGTVQLFSSAGFAEESQPPHRGEHHLTKYDAEVIRLVNAARKEAGLKPLTHDSRLSACARDHSRDMAKHEFFDHTSPVEGKEEFPDRAKLFKTKANAENIAETKGDAARVMEIWMESEGHRAHILSTKYRRIGVGHAKPYWTQLFGK
jgi:uncharacterized protein YkwD